MESKKNLKTEINNYLLIALGTFILTFAIYNIHAQSELTEGGVLGLILLLAHWYKINPSFSSIIMDYSLMITAHYVIGGNFLKYSLFSSFCFSIMYYFLSMFKPVLGFIVVNELMGAVVGGLLLGIGVGMVVRIGGACGGDDSLAMMLSKKLNIKISFAYMITDVTVLLLSLTYIPLGKIVYSLITVTISSNVIEYIKSR